MRWKLNAITLVNNNSSGNQSKRRFDRVYGGQQTERGKELWTYTRQNFAKIAEDIGALGIRVERSARRSSRRLRPTGPSSSMSSPTSMRSRPWR